MNKLKHIDYFEKLLSHPKNELVDKAIGKGMIPIGYTCCIIPQPLLEMDKAFPIKMRASHIDSSENGTYYLSSMTCTFARNILEGMLDGSFDFLMGNVGTSSCIHIGRAQEYFDILNTHKHQEKFFNAMIDVPKLDFKPWVQIMAEQFKNKIAKELAEKYGLDISDESLRKAIKFHNEFNQILQELSDLRKLDEPKITGTEFHTIFTATKVAPREMLVSKLRETLEECKAREGIKDYRAKIMLIGSEMDNPEFTKIIEEQGALVVADRYCGGSLPGLEPIPEEGDPYYCLAEYYNRMSKCPRMLHSEDARRDYALALAKEFKVDGILFELLKFCELWGYENLTFVPDMKEAGIPLVGIERDYNPTSVGQLRTRVQAFIESIEIKKINQWK